MNEMPKKIYARITHEYWTVRSWWPTKPTRDSVDYIRADLVEGLRDVIEWLYGCPYIFDEATIPRAGIAAAPEQVVVNMSVAWPTIQRIAEIHAALEEMKDE